MSDQLSGNILITGGTGSLGSAIIERAEQREWPARFTVLARNETKMAQFAARHPQVRCEIGDVRDLAWLNTIFPGHDLCIHAAAIKQVPTAESNVREAMLTNVVGSQNVAMAAVESGIKRVVGISSDKACAPTTVYGCTKYLMEGLFREANQWSATTKFVTVRYGNVLRSNASVVPLFERQIAEDKPFTLTSLDMTRFWLTMPQAINLILIASSREESGVVLVPALGSMKMVDLARALDPSREITEIGIRPGEKLHEVLINQSEALHTVLQAPLFVIYSPSQKVLSNLPANYEYSSKQGAPPISPQDLYRMLDAYNPYGGRIWTTSHDA